MRRVLITGAAQGIGRALAERFLACGDEVVGVDRQIPFTPGPSPKPAPSGGLAPLTGRGEEEGAVEATGLVVETTPPSPPLLRGGMKRGGLDCGGMKTGEMKRDAIVRREIEGGKIEWIAADLADAEQIDRLVTQLHAQAPFDVVVQNAGISCVGRFASSDLAQQRAVFDVNLVAPLTLTAGLLGADRVRVRGTLVWIASLSCFVGYPSASVYAATKDGLESYARSLRVGLRPRNISMLTVYPGPTRTDHARRYSPDNRRESRRVPPENLAAQIVRSIDRRRTTLIPGWQNRLLGWGGRWFPRLADAIMDKTLLAAWDRRRTCDEIDR